MNKDMEIILINEVQLSFTLTFFISYRINSDNIIYLSELFIFIVQYRGKNSEHFARALHRVNAPCTIMMTLRKLKSVLPSLKPRMPFVLRIDCPHCEVSYIG